MIYRTAESKQKEKWASAIKITHPNVNALLRYNRSQLSSPVVTGELPGDPLIAKVCVSICVDSSVLQV